MKRIPLLIAFALLVTLLSATFLVRAVCDPTDTGTAGNDTIDCTVVNPPSANVQGLGGDDTITIGTGVNATVIVAGDSSAGVAGSGDDTIINDGNVSSIYGDSRNANGSGNDTIVNNGSVGLISGEGQTGLVHSGSDNIVNNGAVGGDVSGDSINSTGSGDDSITNNGTIGGDIRGDSFIGLGLGNDSIVNNGTVTGNVVGDSISNSGSGNDTITNNGNVGGSIVGDSTSGAGSGNDTITNNGNVAGDVSGDTISPAGSGSDSITNNGSVAGSIYGDNQFTNGTGNDTIINNGNVTNIYGDNTIGISSSGNDTITNTGTVAGTIDAGNGNDTVIIEANSATVGGTIEGGADYDVLTFNLTSTSPEELQSWADQIYAANPSGGTLTLAGHTYTWANFEELTQLLFSLARINEIGDPLAVFCSLSDGIDVYAINGEAGFLSLNVSSQAISNGIAAAAESNTTVQIGNSAEAVVYATSSGDVQVNAPNGFSFSFVYQNFCGALPVAGAAVIVVEEEVEDSGVIINRPRYSGIKQGMTASCPYIRSSFVF